MNTFDGEKLAVDVLINPGARRDLPYGDAQSAMLSPAGLEKARSIISEWPGYAPTPLRSLPSLATENRVASIHYKDEGERFGLKSFKPLGGAYAVACLLLDEVRRRIGDERVDIGSLLRGEHRAICDGLTVTAATDGNHGRSVAWGARMFGCHCVIFINEAVSKGRENAIAGYGATVIRNPGSYDDAVRAASDTAAAEGWHVIPDTSDGGLLEAPRNVTQGYALMADEAIGQLPYEVPTHIFLQAGVGGMAAATCARFWQVHGSNRPFTVLVEPHNAACWFQSLQAGRPTAVGGELDSLMGGLCCGEVSHVAWRILQAGADAAMKIDDVSARDAMCLLAGLTKDGGPLVAGESGVAGLAGFLAAAAIPSVRETLGLDADSRILVFGTEGATDPQTYAEIVGRHPEEITA